jgi:alkaline phosphatase D
MPIREQDSKRKIFREFKIGSVLHLLMLDTRQYGRDKQIQPLEYLTNSGFNQAKFYNDLNDSNRNLLGPSQISWIENAVTKTKSEWTIFGQQVLMTKLKFPDISNAFKKIPDELKPYIQLIKLGLPSNLDAWDGYPKDRERLYKIMQRLDKKFISLAGDTHNAWLSELYDEIGNKVGIEIGTPSVTSPGLTDYIPIDVEIFEDSIVKKNSELFWMDASNRGFTSIEISKKQIVTKYNFIKTIYEKNSSIKEFKEFKIAKNYEIEA